MSGILYIIGTPIGNMEDITMRQLRMLEEVDFICAEDTRVTLKLLNRYEIKNQLVSFHEHSSHADAQRITDRIASGENCGIVTDAGMPCISDPGEVLVKMCAERGIEVRVVPGPTAMASAAALSGMHIDRFTFEGFLPVNKKERRQRLELLRNIPYNKNSIIFVVFILQFYYKKTSVISISIHDIIFFIKQNFCYS